MNGFSGWTGTILRKFEPIGIRGSNYGSKAAAPRQPGAFLPEMTVV
jgi:hypothetical protein